MALVTACGNLLYFTTSAFKKWNAVVTPELCEMLQVPSYQHKTTYANNLTFFYQCDIDRSIACQITKSPPHKPTTECMVLRLPVDEAAHPKKNQRLQIKKAMPYWGLTPSVSRIFRHPTLNRYIPRFMINTCTKQLHNIQEKNSTSAEKTV